MSRGFRGRFGFGIYQLEVALEPCRQIYTIEYLKRTVVAPSGASRTVLNLQRSGIGNDLKQNTPSGCGFKSSPV